VAGLVNRIELLLGYGKAYAAYVELYEEKDTDGKYFERRWRLVDENKKIYLSSSTRYVDDSLEVAEQKAWEEIDRVFSFITIPSNYKIKKGKKYVLNLVDDSGEVIATKKSILIRKRRPKLPGMRSSPLQKKIIKAEQIFIVEHVLLRPRNIPGGSVSIPDGDPLLEVCLDCRVQ
jgi:hypothetical protein